MGDLFGDLPPSFPSTTDRSGTVFRSGLALVLTLSIGFAVSYAATDGFQAYTRESARRQQALRSPRPVPDPLLEFSDGRRGRLRDIAATVLLVDFIYTRCQSFCMALGSVDARLQRELAPEIGAGNVRLISVSFDPERDDRAALEAYREAHSRDSRGWDMGRPLTPGGLDTWLSAFGVVVIPDERGGFAHNAAIHVVGPDRRLLAIHGLDDIEGVIRTTRQIIAGSKAHGALH